MKKLVFLISISTSLLMSQGLVTDPDNLTSASAKWSDENNFYVYYCKTQSSSLSLDQKAKPFKMWFYRVDQSNQVHEQSYDFEKQYTVGEAINVNNRHHDQYFICNIGTKIFCFDLEKEDYWEVATVPNYVGGYDAKFYSVYDKENKTIDLYFPGASATIINIDLEERSSESKTFGFEGLSMNEFICKVGNNLFLTAKTEDYTVLWLIYDVVEGAAKMIKFPEFVKTYSSKMFLVNEATDKIYFYLRHYDPQLFHSKNFSFIFEVDMETGEAKEIFDLDKQYVNNYYVIDDNILIESTMNGKKSKYYALINRTVKEILTDDLQLDYIYIYENNIYAYLIVKPGSYRLVQFDKNTLEISTVKDFSVKAAEFIKPITTIDGMYKYSHFIKYDENKNTYTIFNQPAY